MTTRKSAWSSSVPGRSTTCTSSSSRTSTGERAANASRAAASSSPRSQPRSPARASGEGLIGLAHGEAQLVLLAAGAALVGDQASYDE